MTEVEIQHIRTEIRIIQHRLQNLILSLNKEEEKIGSLLSYVDSVSINNLREGEKQ